MSFRNLVLTLHLWAGLLASLFLLVLGLTGSLMVYESEINHALNRRLFAVQPTARPLPVGELFARLERAHPGYRVTDMAFSREPDVAYQMYLNPGGDAEGFVVMVNQYSGQELGDAGSANQFADFVHGLHTHLLMDKHRDAAKLIVGIASIFLLLLSCSGIILWWRRKLFTISWSASAKRLNFDLHNLLGICCSLFLFCFALTGIALTWDGTTSKFVNQITHSGAIPPILDMPSPPQSSVRLDVDEILAAARAVLPGTEIDSFSIHPGEPVDVRLKFPEDRTPVGRSRVWLDPYTGKVLNVWSTRTAPVGFKISRMWIREVHTGDVFGWPTRALACVVSLVLPILTITGTLIWWNRNRKLVPTGAEDTP